LSFVENPTSALQISIELCRTLEEYRQCVTLERAIWNDPDEDLVPSTILLVANKIGGHILLAKDGSRAVGFALAFPAFHGELRYLHSHIVGVIPEYQNRGVGRQLKMKQRELALGGRIALMEWTFDPLAIRNAYFNIARLGATIRRFYPNLYGVTASPLHNGLPTDRLVAEWWLSSARVSNAIAGSVLAAAPDSVEIVVPAEMEAWKKSGSPQAAEVQAALKTEFQERFANGFAVTAFRIENGNGIYVLEQQEN
jgi:predicted GNAT superfamily acetyltransferase